MAAASVNVALGLSGLAATLSGLGKVNAAIGETARSGLNLGTAVAAAKGIGVATVATIALGGALTTVAAGPATEFAQTMSGVGAVAGASAGQLADLQALALQLGKDTAFSANQVAQGLEELVKGGVGIPDIMNGAASAMLNLAAAGGVALPQAAEIAANAMSIFHLHGQDLAHVADQVAGAANASSLSVTDFQFALAQAGAVAAGAGQSFDSLAQAIAVMGANGIKGQDAGTSLRTMLMNLIPQTKAQKTAFRELGIITASGANQFIDAQGHFKSMAEIAAILQRATAGLTDAQRQQALETIFGADAMRAGVIFAREGAAGFNAMAAAMGNVTAASVAGQRLDNLAGDLEQLRGSVETARIAFGLGLMPVLRTAAQGTTNLVNRVIPLAQALGPRLNNALVAGRSRLGAFARNFREVLGGGLGGGTVGGTLATGFLLIRDSITNRVIPALRLLWSTLTGGTAGIDRMSLFQRVILGVARGVEFVARIFQLGIDSVVTFRQALAGDWFRNGAGNAFVNMVGRIGLAFRDLGQAFRSGGFGGALRQLWSGYLQPALTEAWNSLRGWITGTAIPQVGSWLGGLRDRFTGWVRDSLPSLMAHLAAWLMGLGTWVVGTAIPAVGSWLGRLAERFGSWVSQGIVYLRENLPLWLITLQGAIIGWGLIIRPWLVDLGEKFGTWLGGTAVPALAKFAGDAFARLQLLIAANLPGILLRYYQWVFTSLIPAIGSMMLQVGVAFIQGFTRGIDQAWPGFQKHAQDLINTIPGWLRGPLGISGFESTGGTITQGGGTGGGGGGGLFNPGSGGGGGGGGLGLNPITLNVTINNNGMTYEDGGRQMAASLYTELAGLLEGGGGMAV